MKSPGTTHNFSNGGYENLESKNFNKEEHSVGIGTPFYMAPE
jgi:hypothetical protein